MFAVELFSTQNRPHEEPRAMTPRYFIRDFVVYSIVSSYVATWLRVEVVGALVEQWMTGRG